MHVILNLVVSCNECSMTLLFEYFIVLNSHTGMGIGDKEVYQGILITLAWWLLYLILVILFFRR